MASVTDKIASQARVAKLIALAAGEVATIALRPERDGGPAASVNWIDGGISWTIKPQTAGDAISVSVDYSLYAEGDEDWTPHEESPFTAVKQDAEVFRFDRIRFTNPSSGSNPIYVTLASNALFRVETA